MTESGSNTPRSSTHKEKGDFFSFLEKNPYLKKVTKE